MAVTTGIDRLLSDPTPIAGRRVGLLTNPSGVTRDLVPTLDAFRAATECTLGAIFSPEHGIAAVARDGEHVASTVDPISGAPIHSLYGATMTPTLEMLRGLDVLVCDIQDIGVRYYTYFWTLTHVLEGAGAASVPVIVLDRPNPIGDRIDGALLDPAFASLVGRFPIPVTHGMTIGELARWFNTTHNPTPADLSVIACDGCARGMTWEETGGIFVPTSPAMPHLSTVRHYPGACLIEGTTLSEGRGTSLPFEIVGAPGIDGDRLARHLNALAHDPAFADGLQGVRWRAHSFQPLGGKHAGEVCGGVQAHITDTRAFRPLAAWLIALRALRELFPAAFGWREAMFDRLYGSGDGRAWVESDQGIARLLEVWERDATQWEAVCAQARLYRARG
ncbi:MAG: DUF1343 domain-containing protein [Chloroflexota bacterium]|nr:DUF1343 domain-containing protein [Chloroflexota bacterium]